MNKSHLGKELEKISLAKDIKDGQYKILKNAYSNICENLKNNKYDDIPNYYLKNQKLGYYEMDLSQLYSQQLNQILWSFLFFNERSKADLKILDEAIKIYIETNNAFSTMEKSNDVLMYLESQEYKTYLDFTQYFGDLYGIDVDEYRLAKINNFKIPEDAKVYNKTTMISMLISILKKNHKSIFSDLDEGNNADLDSIIYTDEIYNTKLQKHIKESILFPTYIQNYGLPMLQVLKSTKVGFEFSILDKKEHIAEQLKEVYRQEGSIKRAISSSTKQEFLNMYLPKEEKNKRFNSIPAIQKAFTIYQYRQHCQNQEQARQLYNFHILYSSFEKNGFDDELIYSDDDHMYIERDDLITKNYLNDDLSPQINIITSLLNLK